MTLFVLWGRQNTEPLEDFVCESNSITEIEYQRRLAIQRGIVETRIATYRDGDKPDFVKAIGV